MRCARRGGLEGLANDFGDIVIANLPRRSGTRFVEKAIHAQLREPPPPFAHRVGGRADAKADVSVFRAFSRKQDDTRPLRQPLRCLPARSQTLKLYNSCAEIADDRDGGGSIMFRVAEMPPERRPNAQAGDSLADNQGAFAKAG